MKSNKLFKAYSTNQQPFHAQRQVTMKNEKHNDFDQ